MPILEPPISLATNRSKSFDLYAFRKTYKRNVLMGTSENASMPTEGTADFWYDRSLYGKVDRVGNIVVLKEDFLKTLKTRNDKTHYALNFVALAFNEMVEFLNKNAATRKIPNFNTLLANIQPEIAGENIHDQYHAYM